MTSVKWLKLSLITSVFASLAQIPASAAVSGGPSGNFIQNVSTIAAAPAFNVTSGSVNSTFYLKNLTAGRCVETGASGLLTTAAGACGGGGSSSALAVNQNGVQVTSPTVAINALSPPFLVTSVGGGATAQWTLDMSSITGQGNAFNAAGQLVQLNSFTQLPAVSAANLTNIPGANITGTIPATVLDNAIKNQSTLQTGASFYVLQGSATNFFSGRSTQTNVTAVTPLQVDQPTSGTVESRVNLTQTIAGVRTTGGGIRKLWYSDAAPNNFNTPVIVGHGDPASTQPSYLELDGLGGAGINGLQVGTTFWVNGNMAIGSGLTTSGPSPAPTNGLYVVGETTLLSSATISNAQPELAFVETDQVSPRGKYSIIGASDFLYFMGKNSAGANIPIMTLTSFDSSAGGGLTFSSSGTARPFIALGAQSGKFITFVTSTTASSGTYVLPSSAPTTVGQVLGYTGRGGTANANYNTGWITVSTAGSVGGGASGVVNAALQNYIPYYSVSGSSNVLSGSPGITVTTITATDAATFAGVTATSITTVGSEAGQFISYMNTAPTGIGGTSILWGDSTSASFKMNNNAGANYEVLGNSAPITLGHLAVWSSSNSLIDGGTVASHTVMISSDSGPTLTVTGNGGNYGTTTGTSGNLLVTCPNGNTQGMCSQIYSAAGTQSALTGVLNVIQASSTWNTVTLYVQAAGTDPQNGIRVDGADYSTLVLNDTLQSSPGGKFQFSSHNNQFRGERRNTAGNAFESVWTAPVSTKTSGGLMMITTGYENPAATLAVNGNMIIGAGIAGDTTGGSAPLNGLAVQGGTTISSNTILTGATFYRDGPIILGNPSQSVQITSNTVLSNATFYANGMLRMRNNTGSTPLLINAGSFQTSGTGVHIGAGGTLTSPNVTTGDGICIGAAACPVWATGSANVVIGNSAMAVSTAIANNVYIGGSVVPVLVQGNQNTIIGQGGLLVSTNSSNMVAVGYRACDNTNMNSSTTVSGSMCFGRASFVESNQSMGIGSPGFPILDVWMNSHHQTTNNTAGSSTTFHAQMSSGTDKNGGSLGLAAGAGTGAGLGGTIDLYVSSTTGTGTTIQVSTMSAQVVYPGIAPVNLPQATIQTIAPRRKGQIIGCDDCTAITICVSTGTATGAWASPVAKTTACQ